MIHGFLRAGRPLVRAVLIIPRLTLGGEIAFLVDTGSDATLVHPLDARSIGLDHSRDFTTSPLFASFGMAGTAQEYRDICDLFLTHETGQLEHIPLIVAFALPTDVNEEFPSLLGRDVLGLYKLTFEQRSGLVTLE